MRVWNWVAQATGLWRPATRRTQRGERLNQQVGFFRTDVFPFRSAQEFQVQTLFQINQYTEKARSLGLAWTK